MDGKADVVYGSRFMKDDPRRILSFFHVLGNKALTLLSNVFSDLNLTDMETCYKVFKKEVLDRITVEENRFGFEPEVTAKVAEMVRRGEIVIYEVGISYNSRTYKEGKKIAKEFIDLIKKEDEILLNCGIGTGKTSREAVNLATKSLDTIREIRDSGKEKPEIYELQC